MRKLLVVALCLALAIGAYLSISTVDDSTPIADAAAKTYSGKIYVAGMGGHFAVADVEINPKKKQPIKVKDLDFIVIGTGKTHPTHDARIDSENRNQMFWSTYKVDKNIAGGRSAHVGISDLKTGKVIKDVPIALDKRVGFKGALYCGSGQTKDSFLPVTMTKEAYIDVLDKKDLSLKHRVFLDSLGYTNNYIFYHGTNSPDMKTFMVTINKSTPWGDKNAPEFNKRAGVIDHLLLDLPALEKGKVKVLAKDSVTGSKTKTFTFRQYFTPDGKYVLQSGADRMYVLDGKTMKLVDEEMMTDGETHDAIATPDGKYAVLTLRTKSKSGVDGTLQLYDIKKKKLVGKVTSVCNDCHVGKGMKPDLKKAILCGLDANWN
jgi:hypothetical protein